MELGNIIRYKKVRELINMFFKAIYVLSYVDSPFWTIMWSIITTKYPVNHIHYSSFAIYHGLHPPNFLKKLEGIICFIYDILHCFCDKKYNFWCKVRLMNYFGTAYLFRYCLFISILHAYFSTILNNKSIVDTCLLLQWTNGQNGLYIMAWFTSHRNRFESYGMDSKINANLPRMTNPYF